MRCIIARTYLQLYIYSGFMYIIIITFFIPFSNNIL